MIVPDPAAEVRVDFADGSPIEHFFLGDICNTDGSPWECCPRDFLRRAIKELDEVAKLRVVAAFEQEFLYTGVSERRSEEHTSELQSLRHLVCRLLLEKKKHLGRHSQQDDALRTRARR